MNTLERKNLISLDEFEHQYLASNKPIIITDAISKWDVKNVWTPEFFMSNYKNEEVQIYDDLFNLQGITTLGEYIQEYFSQEMTNNKVVPYIRWYTRLKDYEFVWADNFFNKIKNNWQLPYFLPHNNYLLPYRADNAELNPAKNLFPAKGLFISAKGARTRLHYDPWCSDAILCQIYGSKKVTLYDPSQKDLLCNNNEVVDIDNPDFDKFPKFKQAQPSFVDMLQPGEIIFFPHNWLHHVSTISDSISLTWNFVHLSTWPDFFSYLINNPPVQDMEVLNFFITNKDKIIK